MVRRRGRFARPALIALEARYSPAAQPRQAHIYTALAHLESCVLTWAERAHLSPSNAQRLAARDPSLDAARSPAVMYGASHTRRWGRAMFEDVSDMDIVDAAPCLLKRCRGGARAWQCRSVSYTVWQLTAPSRLPLDDEPRILQLPIAPRCVPAHHICVRPCA